MITLKQSPEPYVIDLVYGIQVTVRPLTTAGMLAAQSIARRKLEAIESQKRDRQEAGLSADEVPNDSHLDDPGEREGLFQSFLIKELAVRHILSWIGIAQDDKEAPLTPENIMAVMNLYPVGEKFLAEFTLQQMLLNAAKNGFGPSAAGISPEGPTIAKDVPRPAAQDAPIPNTEPNPGKSSKSGT